MSQTQLTPQRIKALDSDGRFSSEWYKSIEDIYQFSGLAKTNFPLFQDLAVTSMSMTPDPANPPTLSSFIGSTKGYLFDPVSPQAMQYDLQLGHGFINDTDVRPFVQWAPSTGGSGSVSWIMEMTWAPIGSAFGVTSTFTFVSQASGMALTHQFVDTQTKLPGAGRKFSSFIKCFIARDSSSASDTYSDGAFLLSAGVHYLNSAHGTVRAWP